MNSITRIKTIVGDTIDLFKLDLSKQTVLTEAANGYFFVTPIIAALAGAKVIAVTKDSFYGKKEQVQQFVKQQAHLLNVADSIEFVFDNNHSTMSLTKELITKADIITNSGLIRPIDKSFLQSVNPDTVIAGMCEDWEIRKEDIDLQECHKKQINVVAVNEQSQTLDIFRYVGHLAIKMLMECGLELYRTKVLIISPDKFGTTISDVLSQAGAITTLVSKLSTQNQNLITPPYDVVLVADCSSKDKLYLSPSVLKRLLSQSMLIHIAGEIDTNYLEKNGICCYPKKQGKARNMSITLAYLGIKPVIELHTAGLKAASIVFKDIVSGLSYDEIQKKYENHHLCQIL